MTSASFGNGPNSLDEGTLSFCTVGSSRVENRLHGDLGRLPVWIYSTFQQWSPLSLNDFFFSLQY